jgi:hypothetical protein
MMPTKVHTPIHTFLICFWHFRDLLLCRCSQRSARSQEPSQVATIQNIGSLLGWGDAGFEPGAVGQQSDVLPLRHHAFPILLAL